MTTYPNELQGVDEPEAPESTAAGTRLRHAHPLAAQVARIEKEQDGTGGVASRAGDV